MDDLEVNFPCDGNKIVRRSLHKIFQPFFTTKLRGSEPGWVCLYCDEILVKTKEHEGTELIIFLPK